MGSIKSKYVVCDVVPHDCCVDVGDRRDVAVEIGGSGKDAAVVEAGGTVVIDVPMVKKIKKVAPDGGYGWRVAFTSFLITFLMTGFSKSFSIVKGGILEEFPNITTRQSNWLPGLIGTIALFNSPLQAGLVASYGFACLVSVGSILVAVGLVLGSYANDPGHLIAILGIFLGIGSNFLTTSATGCTAKYFTTNKPKAMTLALSGGCVGAMVMPYVLRPIFESFGWRLTMQVFAVVFLVVAIIGRVFADPEANFVDEEVEVPLEDDVKESPKEDKPTFLQRVLKHVTDRLAFSFLKDIVYIITIFVAIFVGLGSPHFTSYTSTRAREIGVGADLVAWLPLCLQIGDFLARLVYGLLASKSPFARTAEFCAGLFVIASCAITVPFCTAYWQCVVLALVGSFSVGVVNICVPLLLSANHGASNMNSCQNLLKWFQGTTGIVYRELSPVVRTTYGASVLVLGNAAAIWGALLLSLVMYLKVRCTK